MDFSTWTHSLGVDDDGDDDIYIYMYDDIYIVVMEYLIPLLSHMDVIIQV